MKTSVRSTAALAALGALASCGAPVTPAAPAQPSPAPVSEKSPVAAPVVDSVVVQKPVAAPVVTPAPVAAKPAAAAQAHAATVSYEAPPGKEEVTFSVTVAPDGTITSAASQGKGAHPKSVRYQETFAAGISGAVVGKKISELDVRAVGGASLTTAAFVKYVRSF